jgi:hypothetical protein
MRPCLIPALAALSALVVALPRTANAERLKVAVVPGIAVNLDATRVDALSQELAEALRSELEIDAIGGLEVRRRLPVQGLPPDCIATQACIDQIARLLAVQQLLFVVMVDTGTGGSIQVDTTWVDPVGGTKASRPPIDIASPAGARAQFAAAAHQLLPDAPVRPAPPGAGIERMSTAVPRHITPPSYATGGAALVGLGLGISFGISARNKYRACDERTASCTTARKDEIRTAALIADAGWLLAIGGAITTAVLYAGSAESPHVIIEPTPGGAAVAAIGRF